MSLDDGGQCRGVEVAACDPARQLVVPNAVVTCVLSALSYVANVNAESILLPRMIWPFFFAMLTTWSPLVKVNVPRDGSVASYRRNTNCILQLAMSPDMKQRRSAHPFHTVQGSQLAKIARVA